MPATLQRLTPLGFAVALALSGCAGIPDVIKLRPAAATTAMPEMAAAKSAAVKPDTA